jgi:alkylation response protein AidB-like acyl-CoA dehydrogenase
MDHETDERRLLRDSVSAFVSAENPPDKLRVMRALPEGFDRQRWRQMAGFGWTCHDVPEEAGGLGLGYAELAVLHEELGRGPMPEPVAAVALGAGAVVAGDSADLKSRWLPKLWEGDALATLAWQGRFGSDDIAFTATPVKDGYRLDGRAVFVPLAGIADLTVVAARAGDGVALFAIEGKLPGLSVTQQRAADHSVVGEVHLAGVNVARSACLVDAKRGAALLDKLLDRARFAAAAELTGAMKGALDLTINYLRVREQFGRPIGSFQALQHQTVDLYMHLELSRGSVMGATKALDAGSAWGLDAGADDASLLVAAAKARCSDAAIRISGKTIHLHGAIGVTEEYALGLFLRRMHFLSAWLGNGNAMRRRYKDKVIGRYSTTTAEEAA